MSRPTAYRRKYIYLILLGDGPTYPSGEIMRIVQETNERLKALQEKYDVRCDTAQVSHEVLHYIRGNPSFPILNKNE